MDKTLETNQFIDTLKFGLEHQKDGISYNEMVLHLKSKNWTKIDNPSFRRWFYKNFFCQQAYNDNKNEHPLNLWATLSIPIEPKYDNDKSVITGEAYFKYLEYIDVKSALENAASSTKIAYGAILITLIVGLIQIAIALFQNCNNIKPH